MFHQRLNELRVTLQIAPVAPLLIKDGRHMAPDPEDPDKKPDRNARCFHQGITRTPRNPRTRNPRSRDGKGYGDYDTAEDCFEMAFVWTQTATGPRFYLPGSSLRGVLRSAAERVIGRWNPGWAYAGDPFNNLTEQWIQQERDLGHMPSGGTIYAMSGPLGRCFGHTALRGHWTVADALMHNEHNANVVVRDGVGISRRTGAAETDVKFQFEAITNGVFETTLTLVNYELWQLGLLAYVLAALDGGEVRLGYGTRRGLGRVRLAVTAMDWRWYGKVPEQHGLDVPIPSLTWLAQQAGLNNKDGDGDSYGWREAKLELNLPLTPATAVFGNAWLLQPTRLSPTDGFASTEWDAVPWPHLADLLPSTLMDWPLPVELEELLANEEAV